MILNIFSCAYRHVENVYADPLPMLKLHCLFLRCKNSLHILDASALSDIHISNIFPQSVALQHVLKARMPALDEV